MNKTVLTQNSVQLKRTSQVIIDEALFIYEVDLEDGIIHDDIIGKNGFNYTKDAGLTSPCTIDDFNTKSYQKNQCIGITSYDKDTQPITCKKLLNAFENGMSMVEETYHCTRKNEYHRMNYTLYWDSVTGHVKAFVFCIDVSFLEKQKVIKMIYEKEKLDSLNNILFNAGIGIWTITLFDSEKPRMSGTKKMYELLGLSNPESMTEEEIYEAWYSRIKKSAIPLVHASVEQMINEGYSENTYCWVHPSKGEIFVRCGGNSKKIEGKGVVLSGYHRDVTSIVTSDIKQKQMLADALAETERQKDLLQKALDDYKQADYDRRTDFLTGLKNRQDMYEMLHDPLSGQKDRIKAMFMMDIDNFKMLNDHYGHKAGDDCLRKIGQALTEYGNANNVSFYRYGGEEILGISFDNQKPADNKANELVKLIYDLNIQRDDLDVGRVTVSLGYTCNTQNLEKMIDFADNSMYKAKSLGKNQSFCLD